MSIGFATDAGAVGVGGMGPDADRALESGADGGGHGVLVPGVPAAGHVDRRHQPEERALHLDPLRIGRLADVGVEVDRPVREHGQPASSRSTTIPSR